MDEKVKKKKTKKPVGRKSDKIQVRQMSVEDINKVIYPEFAKDLAEVLENLYFNPAVELVKKFETIEKIFEAKKDTLTFAEINQYYKTYSSAMMGLLPYIYGKKAVEHNVKKLEVKADYADMLDHLSNKALESKGSGYMEDSIETDWDSLD